MSITGGHWSGSPRRPPSILGSMLNLHVGPGVVEVCCHPLPGMVEMIPHADTLRKIQVEHGVTGSFKDRPLADWLQKHNPTDEQYDRVRTYVDLLP